MPSEPAKLSLVKIINSGLFLWIISAIILTGGAGYLNGYQTCIRDAKQIGDDFEQSDIEIISRRSQITMAILYSNNVEELTVALKAISPSFSRFRDMTTLDLEIMRKSARARIDFSSAPSSLLEEEASTSAIQNAEVSLSDLFRQWSLMAEIIPPEMTNDQLTRAKKVVRILNSDTPLHSWTPHLKPMCSPERIISNVLGNSNMIVKVDTSGD